MITNEVPHDVSPTAGLSPRLAAPPQTMRYALGIALLVALGSLALVALWVDCLHIWTRDPLRSIAMIFPFVALAGVVAAWRRLGWRLEGDSLGLLPIAIAIIAARLSGVAFFAHLFGSHTWELFHAGPILFLFAVGATWFFGGRRLLRAAIAPLCLLLLVNPLPYAFNIHFDLPLQQLSANTARGFAHLIGLQPTGEQLRMMFTPSFGMMIVPGCNGVRGSITFAYLTLIFGYVRHLRPRALAALSAFALLLGYAMNLTRLCVLVLYYRAGLTFASIRPYGTQIDYVIGCTVFLFSTLVLGYLMRSLEPEPGPHNTTPAPSQATVPQLQSTRWRMAIFTSLCLLSILSERQIFASLSTITPDENAVLKALPQTVGRYRLVHTDDEHFSNGDVPWVTADYVAPATASGPESRLQLGLYLLGGDHTLSISKGVQGINAAWTTNFEASTSTRPLHLELSLFDDGQSRELDAEAVCTLTACTNPFLLGKTLSAFQAANKDLPLYLRRTWPEATPEPTPQSKAQFESDVKEFFAALDVQKLVVIAGSPL